MTNKIGTLGAYCTTASAIVPMHGDLCDSCGTWHPRVFRWTGHHWSSLRHHSPTIDSMIDSWDPGDPWGSALAMAFAVAEVSHAIDFADPGRILGYQPSPVAKGYTLTQLAEDDEEEIQYETSRLADYIRGAFDLATEGGKYGEVFRNLTFAARVLHRYLGLCVDAGLDY